MKTLKFLPLIGLFLFIGCSKTELPYSDNEQVNNNNAGSIILSVNAPQSSSTKVSFEEEDNKVLSLTWQTTDSFSLYDASGGYVGDFKYSGSDGEPTGDFAQVGDFTMEDGSYTAVFPAVDANTYPTLTDRNDAEYLTGAQIYKDDLGNLSDVVRMSATLTYSADETNTLTFSHEVAYALLNITLPTDKYPRSIELIDGDETRKYTLTINDYSSKTIKAYLAMRENPTTDSRTLTFNITDQNSDLHTYSGATTATYNAGFLYDVEFTISDPAAVTSYWEDGYTFGGVTYSKDTEGAEMLTSATSITANGVYFLSPENENVVYTIAAGYYNNIVIIGDDPTAKPKVEITGLQRFSNHTSSMDSGLGMIYKNLDVEVTFDGNAFTFAHTIPFDYWAMEDCNIKTKADYPLSYFNTSGATIKNTIFKSNIIRIPESPDKTSITLVYLNNATTEDIESIEMSDNLIFSEGWEAGPLVFVGQTTDTPNLSVKMNNNTFVDYYGTGNGLVYLPNAASVEVKDNIFWASSTNANNTYIFRYTVATLQPQSEDISGNVFYGLTADKSWNGYSTSGTYKPDSIFGKEESDIFDGFSKENATFSKKSSYVTKGSSRH
ncbi:MAG: hypothetical protein SNG27_04940 [Rikenellaceae bacterium]